MSSVVSIALNMVNRLSGPAKKAKRDLHNLEKSSDKVGRAFKKQGRETKGTERALKSMDRTVKKTGRASDGLRRKLNYVGGSFKRLRKETRLTRNELALFSRMEQKAARQSFYNDRRKRVGGRLMKGGATGTAATGFALMKIGSTAFDFSKGMNKAASKMPNASKDEIKMLRKKALGLGATTQFTATQVTGGIIELAAAGMKAKKILGLLPTVVKLAGATDYSMQESADILTNISKQFGRDDYARVGNIINTLVSNANIDLGEFAGSMKYAGVVASKYGLSLEEVGGALMSVAQTSLKADMAGTSMVRMLNALAEPNKAAKESLGKIGMEWRDFFTSDGKSIGINAIIDKFRAKRDSGTIDPLQFISTIKKVFRERGGLFIDAALSRPATEMKANRNLLLNKSARSLDKSNAIMMGGLYGSVTKMTSAIDGLMQAMAGGKGEGGLTDFFISMAENITYLTSVIKDSPLARFFANLLVGGLMLGAILVPIGAIAWALGALGITATAVFSIPMVAIAAISAAGYLVYRNWNKITSFANRTWDVFYGTVTGDTKRMKKGFRGMFDLFIPDDVQQGWSIFFNWFKGELSKKVHGGIDAVRASFESLSGYAGDFFGNIWDGLAPEGVKTWWKNLFDFIKKGFSEIHIFDWIRGKASGVLSGTSGASAAIAKVAVSPKAHAASSASVGQNVAHRISQVGAVESRRVKEYAASASGQINASGVSIAASMRKAADDIAQSAAALSRAAKIAKAVPAGDSLARRVNNSMFDH